MAEDHRSSGDVTRLLAEWRAGSGEAFNRLVPVVYDELKRLARRQLRARRADARQTLNTTALVHEAYVRLAAQTTPDISTRHHFMAVAATAMRHIVVDHARRRGAAKRGSGHVEWELHDADEVGIDGRQAELLEVDDALTKLSTIDPRLTQLVELRVFAGASVAETGAALNLSERTVKRDWQKARAFLQAELAGS